MIGYLDKFTLNLKDFEGVNYEELKNIFTFVTMKYFLIFFFSLITLNTFTQVDSILFLGNSYTSSGNVPGLLNSLVKASGKELFIDTYTPGGKQLSQHYSDPTSLSKINSHQWDYVVLQEQSQMPLIDPNTTIYYGQKIAIDQVKLNNKCTEVITYMTWARKAGNSWLNEIGLTHDEMAGYYENFYSDIWKNIPGRVSPVGKAFHEATKQGLDVYSGDGSHQNSTGAYLSALVFYATIYKESPIGLTYSTLSESLTQQCQLIASDVVMKDLHEHNILKVNFNIEKTNLVINEKTSFNELVYMEPFPFYFKWTFEGSEIDSSTNENPEGILFNQIGSHSITLEIKDECSYSESRTFKDTIKVSDITSLESFKNNSLLFYPTSLTSQNKLHISNESKEEIIQVNLFDVNGQVVESTYQDGILSFGKDLPPGAYLVVANQKSKQTNTFIFIKN